MDFALMVFHARNGQEFVGLRATFGGRRQVVYDAAAGKRVILNISDRGANDAMIEEALREGLQCRNILGGVIAALQARKINVDFVS